MAQARSENTTLLPSSTRRTFLQGTAGALALSASAATALASSTEPDADLLDLGRRLDALLVEEKATAAALFRAEDAIEAINPPVPEELFCRGEDCRLLGRPAVAINAPAGNRRWWCYGDVDAFRRAGRPDVVFAPDERRRQEIIRAWDRWFANLEAAKRDSGLTAAEEARSAVIDKIQDVRTEIAALPALTLAGLLVKAKAAAWPWPDGYEDDDDADVNRLLDVVNTLISHGANAARRL